MYIGGDIVRDGLVLHLDAGSERSYPKSGTVWKDLSGNRNNGTLTNSPTYNTTNNGNISFDGIDDYISTNLILSSPTNIPTTFEVVFKNNSASTFKGLIGASAYQSSGFSVGFIGQTTLRLTYNASTLSYEPQTSYNSSVISVGVFIFNGRNLMIYRNGVLLSSVTASFDATQNNNPIRIGSNLQGGWTTSQIDLYSVKVYNRALTVDEVEKNYNTSRKRFGL